jgi:hypothetical protein
MLRSGGPRTFVQRRLRRLDLLQVVGELRIGAAGFPGLVLIPDTIERVWKS